MDNATLKQILSTIHILEKQIANCVKQHQTKRLSTALVQQLPAYLHSIKEVLPEIRSQLF